MKRKNVYFRKGDLIPYAFLFLILGTLVAMAFHTKPGYPSHAEIYVSGKLQYLLALTEQEKNIFVDTELGGVNVKFQNKMVRVTSSNSPLKLCVKQGWIKNPGETIIGIPDKLIIKIIASSDEEKEFDSVIR